MTCLLNGAALIEARLGRTSISLSVNEADLPTGNAPQAISWNPPSTGPFSAGQARTTGQVTNGSTNNKVGDSVQRYSMKAVPGLGRSQLFLIVLGPAPTN